MNNNATLIEQLTQALFTKLQPRDNGNIYLCSWMPEPLQIVSTPMNPIGYHRQQAVQVAQADQQCFIAAGLQTTPFCFIIITPSEITLAAKYPYPTTFGSDVKRRRPYVASGRASIRTRLRAAAVGSVFEVHGCHGPSIGWGAWPSITMDLCRPGCIQYVEYCFNRIVTVAKRVTKTTRVVQYLKGEYPELLDMAIKRHEKRKRKILKPALGFEPR